MNNSYNIGGNIYTGISEFNTGRNNYLFISSGNNISFLRQTPNKNYENNYGGRFYPIALEDYRWANIIAEDMILNKLAARLTEMYGLAKTEITLDNIVSYLSYAATELQKIGNIDFDIDPNLSMAEKESAFREKCDAIAMDIDNSVMARMRSNGKEVVDNYYKDDIADISLQDIISHLSLYDLNNLTPLIKESDDPLKTTIEYLSNRDDIKELAKYDIPYRKAIKYIIIEGHTVEEVLKLENKTPIEEPVRTEETIEKDKVKTLTLDNKNNAAYVDLIVLCLIAQLTIFLVLLGVLYLVK
nr:hypothetical protein [Bacilli bacterium]